MTVAEPSTKPAVDPRRATAERNAAAILDAAERLLADRTPLSMVAIAGEAGVSRPTLYAHYKSIAEIVEAAVKRSVVASLAAFEHARPDDGPADQALLRMAEVSLRQLGRYDALARGAAEHLPPGAVHRSHNAMLAPLRALIERGRDEGVFRTDVPTEWLLSMYFALVHGADEHAAGHDVDRDQALQLLNGTLIDLFTGGRRRRAAQSAGRGGGPSAADSA
jgi:TetR/AcrR family transcriptional regulator, mexCD-oprJ operon repressor